MGEFAWPTSLYAFRTSHDRSTAIRRVARCNQLPCRARPRRAPTTPQGGDQFLDGIGETGLVARYVLDANAEDSSRNQFHAALRGSGGTFVDDEQFRRALLLTGDGSHLQLPGETLTGEDTHQRHRLAVPADGRVGSVLRLRPERVDEAVSPSRAAAGFRASIVLDGKVRGETAAAPFLENQWVHLAVVLDPASRVLTTYLDGARVGQAADVAVNAAQIVHQTAGAANRLFIGRSQDDAAPDASTRGCATSASIASR